MILFSYVLKLFNIEVNEQFLMVLKNALWNIKRTNIVHKHGYIKDTCVPPHELLYLGQNKLTENGDALFSCDCIHQLTK